MAKPGLDQLVSEALCLTTPPPWECELLAEEPACREPAEEEPAPELPLCDRSPFADAFSLEDGSFEILAGRLQQLPMPERLECISRRFLSLPYELDPLGEGEGGDVDRDPLFRFDALDCMTFVEEVLAAAHARSADDFLTTLSAIRYRNEFENFGTRNHFVEADWIPNNLRRGLIRDITSLVGGNSIEAMQIMVDRTGWVQQHRDLSNQDRSSALFDLWLSRLDQPEAVAMAYIPISAFLLHAGTSGGINRRILESLPEVSIAVFLRNPDAARKIGVMVAHMGLLIVPRDARGRPMTPILRHASSANNAIVDEPLDLYLEANATRRAGIAILQIVD